MDYDTYENNQPFGVLRLQSRQILADPTIAHVPADYFPSTVTIDTEFGTIAIGKSQVTFKNINLASILGQNAWDDHSVFKLQMTQFYTLPFTGGQAHPSVFASPFGIRQQPTRGTMAVHLSGLPWLHSSYNTVVSADSQYAKISMLTNFIDNDGNALLNASDMAFVANSIDTNNSVYFAKGPTSMVSLTFNFAPDRFGLVVAPVSVLDSNVFNLMMDFYACLHISAVR